MKKLIKNIIKIFLFLSLVYLSVHSVVAGDFSVTLTNYNTDTKVANISWAPTGANSDNIDHYKVFVDGKYVEKSKVSKDTTSFPVPDVTEGATITVHAYDANDQIIKSGDQEVETGSVTAKKENVAPVDTFTKIVDTFEPTKGVQLFGGSMSILLIFLARIIKWILALAGLLSVFAVAYSGYIYISSLGNEEKAEKAKKNLTWSIIGILIIVFLYAILQLVSQIITTSP